jgi:hypothetical protein
VAWEVEFTDEFGACRDIIAAEEQESVRASVNLLRVFGPTLRFPHSSGVSGSRHSRMRELRIQHEGRPYRVLYAIATLQRKQRSRPHGDLADRRRQDGPRSLLRRVRSSR